MGYRYTQGIIPLMVFSVMFHCVYCPTLSDVLPPYLPSAVEHSTPFDIRTCSLVHMHHLLLDAGLQGVGLSDHVPIRPAVPSRIIFFEFDAVREFFDGSHGQTIGWRLAWRLDWRLVWRLAGLTYGARGSGRTKSGSESCHLCAEETIRFH